MKTLIVGTTNSAKISQVQGALSKLDIHVTGVPEHVNIPEIPEDGFTPAENARKKALAYATVLRRPVLAMDNALYLDKLQANDQPGINVRRIPNAAHRPTDNELLDYYSGLIDRLGGTTGRWEFACCLADSTGVVAETLIESPRLFVSRQSQKVIPGFPLDSLQIDPETGIYVSEMDEQQREVFRSKGFGKKLSEFISPLMNRLEI